MIKKWKIIISAWEHDTNISINNINYPRLYDHSHLSGVQLSLSKWNTFLNLEYIFLRWRRQIRFHTELSPFGNFYFTNNIQKHVGFKQKKKNKTKWNIAHPLPFLVLGRIQHSQSSAFKINYHHVAPLATSLLVCGTGYLSSSHDLLVFTWPARAVSRVTL